MLVVLLFLSASVKSNAMPTFRDIPSYLITADDFKDLGTWSVQNAGRIGPVMQGITSGKPTLSKPAIASVNLRKSGKYRIWIHAMDSKTQQGSRFFRVAVNGNEIIETFGQHGNEGYLWTDGGVINLNAGENEISLIDKSGFFARCDGIFIMSDLEMKPTEDYETLVKVAMPINVIKNQQAAAFPSWANARGKIEKEEVLESEHIKVVFLKALDKTYGSFVQNEIYIKEEGKWIKVKDRADDHGYLLLKAQNNVIGNWVDGYILQNIYKKGTPMWLIPRDFIKVDEHNVRLIFKETKELALSVTWNLKLAAEEPKVTLTAKFKEKGNYSFGLFSGRTYRDNEYESALLPFRVMEKRVPKESSVILEHYLFTPMGSITLLGGNKMWPGKKLTSSIVLDPDWMPKGFSYRENSRFGIGLRTENGELRPQLFAPVFGAKNCEFNAGDEYQITYLIVNRFDTWFDNYKHIAQTIFNVHDYRSNYYTSLNEAIYNTTDLMLDKKAGGWDSLSKAHYNMEEKDLTSVANPMEAVQRYLLTEDDRILTTRVIPTLANLLTRGQIHFKRLESKEGSHYVPGSTFPMPIGKPINGYNLSVYGGLYEMSHGQIPALLSAGIQKSKVVTNAYGNIPQFANDLALYRYTNDQSYLKSAKEKASKYLEDVVYGKTFNSELPPLQTFINISYFPNLASLLDIYDETKEQKYLDAAVKTGQMLCTTLWVSGIEGKKGEVIEKLDSKAILSRDFMKEHDFWWYGSNRKRVGAPENAGKAVLDTNSRLVEESVPGWVPSRVGLGLEQGTTFARSLNIYMSTWAGDLIKLAALSGEKYFEVAAKNAIIGRFGNYSGYYQDRIMTHQMKPDYPYTGPDLSGLYWHHLPPFLSMLEDFLINQVFGKSKQQIKFPSVRQQGYAYFNSNQYGFDSGKFYDLDKMWLWNDRGIIKVNSKQINYLPVKKDGLFAVALINEAPTPTQTIVELDDKIPGGKQFSGTGVLYDEEGKKQKIAIDVGKFSLEIPGKGMRSVAISIPGIKAPKFAMMLSKETDKTDLGKTVAEHTRGKAYVLQLSPEKYFAYIYLTDLPDVTKEMKVYFTIGTKSASVNVTKYPFECIIPVNQPSENFTYTIETTDVQGKSEKITGNTLKPFKP